MLKGERQGTTELLNIRNNNVKLNNIAVPLHLLLIRCLSIPVTLRAALSHSSQLLEQKPALLLQNYHQSVKEFERAIHSGSSGDADQELGLVGRATMNMHVSDHVTLLGQETELTNLM